MQLIIVSHLTVRAIPGLNTGILPRVNYHGVYHLKEGIINLYNQFTNKHIAVVFSICGSDSKDLRE
jgi:hypothetical protein